MDKKKILMAEDEKDVLDVMARKVATAGYEVITAMDGEEAWDKIQKENPDVVLLDLNIPKKDGFRILKDLRSHPPSTRWIPVIIISARTELQDMQKGFDLEAEHYLTKPCTVDDILKGIRLVLSLVPRHKTPEEIDKEK